MHVFVFRRDFRTEDNLGLAAAARLAAPARLTPVFVFNPRQVDADLNPYRSARSVDFMVRALRHLKRRSIPELRMLKTYTKTDVDVLAAMTKHGLRAVHFNADVASPYARERDARIADWCARNSVECHAHAGDYCLVDPAKMPKPYQRFAPFYRRHIGDAVASAAAAAAPAVVVRFVACPPIGRRYYESEDDGGASHLLPPGSYPDQPSDGNDVRTAALSIVARIGAGAFAKYAETRDDLGDARGTTHLGAHLKFGTVSVREAFRVAPHELGRQMMWRAFYDQVAYHFPRVLAGQLGPSSWNRGVSSRVDAVHVALDARMRARRRAIWDAACRLEPDAGVPPLVAAGLRELVTTGRMHNRARMVVAVYLVKTLRIDWRIGERFFARHLVDYHPPANSGGWQWAAGCGADAMPYFRTMSPALQAKKHDPAGAYVSAAADNASNAFDAADELRRWVASFKAAAPRRL